MTLLSLLNGKLIKSGNLIKQAPCCCVPCKQCYCFCGFSAPASPGDRAHAKTYTVPDRFLLPVKVNIVGVVDDVWMLDGDGTVDNQIPVPGGTAAHGFNYTWTQEERTFTIEALDTFSENIAIGYTLCIMALDTNPSEECAPRINASNDSSCCSFEAAFSFAPYACEECCCSYINGLWRYTIRINFSRSWGGSCIDVPYDIELSSLTNGDNCLFTIFTDIDNVLCDPETYCGSIRISLRLVNPANCNCDTGENCQLELVGWEAINCDGGIASVQLIEN